MSFLRFKITSLLIFFIVVTSHSLLEGMQQKAVQARTFQDSHCFPEFDLTTEPLDRRLIEAAAIGNLQGIELSQVSLKAQDSRGRTALYMAAYNGHEAVVGSLLAAGADVDDADDYGTTSLYVAAQNGYDAVVRLLLRSGAHINAANNIGTTPLHVAAFNGHKAVVQQLIAAGANVNAARNDGATPLHRAVYNGHEVVVQQLIEAGANLNPVTDRGRTPLHEAIQRQHPRTAQLLIRNGAISSVTRIAKALGSDNTLAYTAAVGDNNRVQTLLTLNPSLQETQQALLYATGQGHEGVVNQLVARANPHEALRLVDTILLRLTAHSVINVISRYQAIQHSLIRRLPLVEQILRRPALFVNLIPGFYRFPIDLLERFSAELRAQMTIEQRLRCAALTGNDQLLRQVLDAGVSPNALDEQGYAPCWLATRIQDEHVIENMITVLFLYGFDPNIPNPNRLTLIEWAVQNRRFNVARLLLSYGAHAAENIVTNIPLTNLARAALGNIDQLQYLLSAQLPSEEVEDALMYAVGQGQVDSVRLLVHVLDTLSPQHATIVDSILRRRMLTPRDRSNYQLILQILRPNQEIYSRLNSLSRLMAAFRNFWH